MSPEFGSTAAIFPIDEETIDYLRLTGRGDEQVALVEAYAKEQGMWHDPDARAGVLRVHRAGPVRRRAVDRRPEAPAGPHRADRREDAFRKDMHDYVEGTGPPSTPSSTRPSRSRSRPATRRCCRSTTTTPPMPSAAVESNGRPRKPVESKSDEARRVRPRPRCGGDRRDHVMHQHLQPVGDARCRAAGQKRREEGPDGQAVGEDHDGAGLAGGHRLLQEGRPVAISGEAGLHLVGYGCTTCIGNSGPLPEEIRRPSTRATCPSSRCCRATATSRAGSTPT